MPGGKLSLILRRLNVYRGREKTVKFLPGSVKKPEKISRFVAVKASFPDDESLVLLHDNHSLVIKRPKSVKFLEGVKFSIVKFHKSFTPKTLIPQGFSAFCEIVKLFSTLEQKSEK